LAYGRRDPSLKPWSATLPILISQALIAKLPAAERSDIKEYLEAKSGGICSLCDDPLNAAAETIEPDHEIPEREGGATDRANLNLAHRACNGFKRNSPSVDVRPFLRYRRFLARLGHLAHYDDCFPFFSISPAPTKLEDGGATLRALYPDGTIVTSDVRLETNRSRTYRFAFMPVPRSAIFNDDECQPRTIKPEHLWKLYSDIQRNPLHEPPSLRIGPAGEDGLQPLLMFDGQHKSIAVWLSGRTEVVAKVYLDLPTDETINLVNSIQARIPKLPLSTFELAAKMDDENRARLETYLVAAGGAATEKGFIDSVEVGIRDRVRAAFRLALANAVIQNPDLEFIENVVRAGERATAKITETVFKTKVIDVLLNRAPLEEPWSTSEVLRGHEQDSIIRALNRLNALAFQEPPGGFSALQTERRRRLMYQSSLAYVASLLRRTFGHVLAADEDRELLDKEPDAAQWATIDAALTRLVEHPIWTADFAKTPRLAGINTALTRNQEAGAGFRSVGLTTGYLVGADPLPADWTGE
jgi:hypothetical protein